MARLLVADDQADVIEALRLLLKREGHVVESAHTPAEVATMVSARDYDSAIIDLNYTRDTTSGREGLDLLQQLMTLDATLPVVVMTAWASIDSAVEAMRRGARDYVEKPWDNERLLSIVRSAVDLGRALRHNQRLEGENRSLRHPATPSFIAGSPVMRPVLQLIEQVGPSDANVLITGEHGTGKELVANLLHGASPRMGKPFVAVNLGGIAEGVFESEMFGHVKGAFTDARADRPGRFEIAQAGTLFLDEIGNLSLGQQAKLLRVLQTGEFERVGSSKVRQADVRVLSATNVDIASEVAGGRFREDLLFRINTIELHLPALRERREDVGPLAHSYLQRHAQRYRKPARGFEPAAMQALLDHAWPGNVRELGHVIERAVLLARGELIGAGDLALRPAASASVRLEDLPLEEVERILIRKALAKHGGNVSRAARALGLSRSALYRRLEHFRIVGPDAG
ncbi:MAG: sigma-54-dependent Fis family transcriptional regulator [Gemmatimonadaceae bacterium]|nr:sigma-54-dependent Fis family transcriptional regulator [Gemmatimonadaceae bacterium]